MTGRDGSTLDVRLLGPIAAERSGEGIALGGPRQRAVLARLALVPGQVVTVDRLIDDVWAGEPPATAVNTLQSYVSLLRRALGDPQHLRREGPGYLLAVDRDVLDASRFEDQTAAGREALAGDPATALRRFDAALAEWRGPALADVVDEEWARPAAVRWEELRLAALEARFDALLALGRHGEVVGELERAVEEHPLREGLARRLMMALYRCGRQADALRAYTRTRQLLADELGLDPTPELVTLQTAILNHDPELVAPIVAASVISPSATTPSPPAEGVREARAGDAPQPATGPVPLPGAIARAEVENFTGRERQLAVLHRIWAASRSWKRHIALLTGEAGAGKTRLAARFAADVHATGGIVLWGRATPEAIVPYQPVVEALRTILRTVSPDARRRIAADRGLLSALLPELEQLVPEAQPERRDPAVERYLLFETVAEMLGSESPAHPLLFVLDDVQWADVPSLQIIEHVLRHELPGRLMVVATMRMPSDTPHTELDRMATDLGREGLLTRVPVGALDLADVDELLRAGGHDNAQAEELRAATSGNAFFLTELIRHADGRPLGDELPESVKAMIGVRLDQLDPVVHRVLTLTAVAGEAATLSVLVAASGLHGDELLDATHAAVAAGLVVEDGAGRLGMPHALIRQVVLSRLSRTRRLDLHRRVADALEQTSEAESSPAAIAHHLLEAGSLTDRARRIEAGIAAARRALAVGAYEDASSWAEHVDDLVVDPDDRRSIVDAALVASDAARARGDREAAVDAARRAAASARVDGDPMLLARAAEAWMLSLSAVGFDIGRAADPELVVLMETAIASLPASERQYAVRIRSMLSSVLVVSSKWPRRESLATEALRIAEVDGRPEVLASAHLAQRLAWWRLDRLAERTEIVLKAVDEAREAGDVHLELTAMLFAMSDLMESARLDEHRALLTEFRARAADLRQPLYDVYARFIEAGNLLGRGEYEAAERVADEALEVGLSSHGVNARIAHAGVWYRIAQDRGRLADSLPEAERMAAATRLRMWQVVLLAALVAAGRHDDARRVFADLVGTDRVNMRDNQMFLPAACSIAETTAVLGDVERAGALRRALEPYADRLAVSGLGGVSIGPVSRYVGVSAFVCGDLDAAERFLEQAVKEAVRLGMHPHEARARNDLGAVLRNRGNDGDAERSGMVQARATAIALQIGLVLTDLP